MTKILFVIPDYANEIIDKHMASKVIPYGVLSLVSYIEHYCPGTDCEIIDFNVIDNPSTHIDILKHELKLKQPDILAISAMYNSCYSKLAPFCEAAKQVLPNVLVLSGGILATNLTQDIFNSTNLLDAVCYGEGEIPFKDLILSNDIKNTLHSHKSWTTKEDYENGKRPSATLVENLDEIPILNYSKVDITKYDNRIASLDGIEKTTLPVHSTRGCPYSCVFCCSGANHGRKTRYMSAKRFLSDVKTIIDKYKIKKLSIDDDQFLFNRERAKEILRGLADFNIEIEMANGLTVKFIDDEIAMLLKNAGLKTAVLAVESGSPRVLKEIINKPLDISQIQPAVKSLRKAGLFIHTFFIIGFPNETQEDRDMTRNLIIDVGFDWNGIFIATPFKGSKLYDICVQNNYIKALDITNPNIYQCQITAPGVNPEEITKQAYLMNLDVNFVNNHNYRNGNYDKAIAYFSKIATRYHDHAFAHYFLAKSLEGIKNNDINRIKELYTKFDNIINSDIKWKEYAEHFNLEIKKNKILK